MRVAARVPAERRVFFLLAMLVLVSLPLLVLVLVLMLVLVSLTTEQRWLAPGRLWIAPQAVSLSHVVLLFFQHAPLLFLVAFEKFYLVSAREGEREEKDERANDTEEEYVSNSVPKKKSTKQPTTPTHQKHKLTALSSSSANFASCTL